MSFWPRRRFRITPLRAVAAFCFMIVLFWYSLGRQEVPQQPCSVPEEYTEKLHELAYRYAPLYEESSVSDNQPYTIIIQLPKREEKRRNHYHEKYYDGDDVHDHDYIGNRHYNDHDEDFASRAFHIGEKKVRIKATEDAGSKVHIKISRIDDDKGIVIADKNNMTILTTPIFLNKKLLPTRTAETKWLTSEPPLFFQRYVQGV